MLSTKAGGRVKGRGATEVVQMMIVDLVSRSEALVVQNPLQPAALPVPLAAAWLGTFPLPPRLGREEQTAWYRLDGHSGPGPWSRMSELWLWGYKAGRQPRARSTLVGHRAPAPVPPPRPPTGPVGCGALSGGSS